MKTITRSYPIGCKHCGATGFVDNPNFGKDSTATRSLICPVCYGSKVVTVIETEHEPDVVTGRPDPKTVNPYKSRKMKYKP